MEPTIKNTLPENRYIPVPEVTITKVANGFVVKPTQDAVTRDLLVFRDYEDMQEWLKSWGLI